MPKDSNVDCEAELLPALKREQVLDRTSLLVSIELQQAD